jgi:hypothetical protein
MKPDGREVRHALPEETRMPLHEKPQNSDGQDSTAVMVFEKTNPIYRNILCMRKL